MTGTGALVRQRLLGIARDSTSNASGRAAARSAANRPTTFQVIKTRNTSTNSSPGITKAACLLGNLLHSFLTALPRTLQPLGKAPNYYVLSEKPLPM
jgi:hypothetical protein